MDLLSLRYAISDVDEELSHNLFALAKGGGGWKSEAQGRFQLKRLQTVIRPLLQSKDYKEAVAWARRQGVDTDTAFVWPCTRMLKQYGRSTTKARYTGNYFVVDESGVRAIAKVRVNHKPPSPTQLSLPDEPQYLDLLPETAVVAFERTSTPTITVPWFAETKADDAKREQARRQNQPLVDVIKNLAGYSSNDFLQSIVYQLEAGNVLSPKQQQVLNTMLPKTQRQPVDSGSPSEWRDALSAFYTEVERKVLPGLIEILNESDSSRANDPHWKPYNADTAMPALWTAFKNGSTYDVADGWFLTKIFGALVTVTGVGIKNQYNQDRPYQLRDLMTAAIKSKGALSKVRLDAVLTIKKLAERLQNKTEAQFTTYWRRT